METSILIFLGVALVILALALVLPRLFRKSIERDKRRYDLNADRNDGRGTATWIGINKASGDGTYPDL